MAMTTAQPFNILFTSAGRRVELLRAFRRAYETLRLPGQIIGLDINPLAPALQVADVVHIVPRLTDPAYIPTLVQICRTEQARLIFPLIDPDIAVLAAHRAVIEQTGARLAVIPAEQSDVVADKWLTRQFFDSLGLPTPASWLPSDPTLADRPLPLFVKPRRGSASQSTFKASTHKELAFFSEYVPDAIVQEFLPGPEITSDVVCDLDSKVLAVVSRRRMEVRGGEVMKGVTLHDAEIDQACRRIAAALPAIGPITVQCMLKDGRPYFTEINARMGGGLPLAIAAGADIPLMLLARTAGLPLDVTLAGTYRDGCYVSRYDDAFFFTQDDPCATPRRHL